MATESANGHSRLRTLALVIGISLGAALLITSAYEISHEQIIANERARLMANLGSVSDLPAAAVPLAREIPSADLPDSAHVSQLFAMHADAELQAWVYSAVAPQGYNGPIEFLIGLTTQGRVIRIRIMQHRETPGLGDQIEADKSDWLRQFEGRRVNDPENWNLAADGGEFDAITGATVTPRTMVAAIHAVLQYHSANEATIAALLQAVREQELTETP